MGYFDPEEIRLVYENDGANPAAQDFYADNLNAEVWTAEKAGKPDAQLKPLAELERVLREHPENEHVAEAYSDALVHRCIAMGFADVRDGVEELRKTMVKQRANWPDNLTVAQSTALVMMATWGVGDSADEPLARQALAELYQKYAGDEVIDDVKATLQDCTTWEMFDDAEEDNE